MSDVKTVVELDLVGYSDVVRNLEEKYGAQIIFHLNDQIQEFVDVGLSAVDLGRDRIVLATNGDNAVLAFEKAVDAHNFSKTVQEYTNERNLLKERPSDKRWFRIGCATGNVAQRRDESNEEITGIVIADAYRLEAKAEPGGILIDENTYNALSAEIQSEYGGPKPVSGKRKEKYQAYQWVGLIADESSTSDKVTVFDVLDLFVQLQSAGQLIVLMNALEIPKGHRPSNTLTLYEQQGVILDLMNSEPDGLKKLADTLKELIKRQKPQNPR